MLLNKLRRKPALSVIYLSRVFLQSSKRSKRTGHSERGDSSRFSKYPLLTRGRREPKAPLRIHSNNTEFKSILNNFKLNKFKDFLDSFFLDLIDCYSPSSQSNVFVSYWVSWVADLEPSALSSKIHTCQSYLDLGSL